MLDAHVVYFRGATRDMMANVLRSSQTSPRGLIPADQQQRGGDIVIARDLFYHATKKFDPEAGQLTASAVSEVFFQDPEPREVFLKTFWMAGGVKWVEALQFVFSCEGVSPGLSVCSGYARVHGSRSSLRRALCILQLGKSRVVCRGDLAPILRSCRKRCLRKACRCGFGHLDRFGRSWTRCNSHPCRQGEGNFHASFALRQDEKEFRRVEKLGFTFWECQVGMRRILPVSKAPT